MKNNFAQREACTTGAMTRVATFQTMGPPSAPKPSRPISAAQTCEDCTKFTFSVCFSSKYLFVENLDSINYYEYLEKQIYTFGQMLGFGQFCTKMVSG
jgi:hypothetical protein